MKKLLTLLLTSFVVLTMQAQELNEHLVMQFDFENVDGKKVSDPISGITAKLMNQATVTEMGQYQVLDLGKGTGYLDMTNKTGNIIKQLGDFTISTYYRVSNDVDITGSGFFLWCFSKVVANTETTSAYSGYRLNAQRFASSSAGWGSEVGMSVGTASVKGQWVHVLYRQTGSNGELFINGSRVQSNSDMPLLSTIFTSAPAYNWIGRAPFSGDSYLTQTLVTDFRVYDTALATSDITELSEKADKLNEAYRYGTKGDDTALRALLTETNAFIAQAQGYAPNAIAELQDMALAVTNVLSSGRASQTYLDEYSAKLTDKLASTKKTLGYAPMKVFTVNDQHGFAHPGGIVSAEDIERAKALLAAGNTRIKAAWDLLCGNEYSQSGVQTWPTETIIRGGSGQNYMNAARGATMAYQNALRWKIGGTRDNADAAVRILMAWANTTTGLGGTVDKDLASGIYGYQFANAAELMRDYDGWSKEDFEKFQHWMVNVFYNQSIDFLRRRNDCWSNYQYPSNGQRPGHYWSNWGLCNALCVMSIGILTDDVHMYNEGMSFYKYDHVGTYHDRTSDSQILNDGCPEFIGNLVPVVLEDERGPLGYLGQMQESGRDQGHTLMSIGLAFDACQIGFSQGDDLYAYMDDRIAAGAEFVASMNFGGVDAATLPWIPYNYADRWGTLGNGWWQGGPNTSGAGEHRPGWDRVLGYYEGLRGVKMKYCEDASGATCPDGGGGNYSSNSGGFDDIGFSTLTQWRPTVTGAEGITPLTGNIEYKGVAYENQTNLGGLKYDFNVCASKAIPADSSDIVLRPQLPGGIADTGNWKWDTGETTRDITVKADKSHVYRVTYTAANGTQSHQSFAIAVYGDGMPVTLYPEITVDGIIESITEKTVLAGTDVILYAGGGNRWGGKYLWDNGGTGSVITINNLNSSRDYLCQFANMSGAVSEELFHLNVVEAIQYIDGAEQKETYVLPGSDVTLNLQIPDYADPQSVVWQDGTTGTSCQLTNVQSSQTVTATYNGNTYTYTVNVKEATHTYYDTLSTENGYQLVSSTEALQQLAADNYFVLAADEADLLLGLEDAKMNGNKALHYQKTVNPLDDVTKLFTIESTDPYFHLRNVDYDGLLLQTEYNAAYNLRTHDQPYACEWSRLLFDFTDGAWTIENGVYGGNWLGLWAPENGYVDGEETALNKQGDEVAHFQLFAINKERFLKDYTLREDAPRDITPMLVNPSFAAANGYGWSLLGSWGNQRFNGAAEVWHSSEFDITQTISGLPDGEYTITCQMVNGEGSNTGYLYATSGSDTETSVVTQSCANSDFDTQRDKMAASDNYGKLSVTINVLDGNLTLGVKEPSSGTTWLVFDNFTLTYNGPVTTAIKQVDANTNKVSSIYDLQGRKYNAITRPGIYIIDNRKVIIR